MEEQAVIEKVENTLDSAVETVVPEVVETIETVRNNPLVLAGVALVGLSVGAFIGFKVAEKRLATKFDILLEEEMEKTRRFYATTAKNDYPTVEDAVEALVPEEVQTAMTNYGSFNGAEEVVVEDEVEVVEKHNIFVNGAPLDKEFDYEAEVAKRSIDRPFVITEEEFLENTTDYEQLNFTYYEGDDVLTDERDEVVHQSDSVVGDDNLKRFGHGSNDRNTVFVRNTKTEQEFEIARSTGKYAAEVLGFNDEETQKSPPRRFRGSDE